jgi:predicted NAD/FAD-binding protein
MSLERKRIAIVGTGISGLVAAHRLHPDHDITVYEANDYVGGHTHTIDVELKGQTWSVDTGFIVFNESNYFNFIALLDELGVSSHRTEMSFSVRSDRADVEYNGTSLEKLFVQRRNLVRPSFYRMVADIVRFYRESKALLSAEDDDLTLGDYLKQNGYGNAFIDQHIVPMGSAIWSADPEDMLSFPARHFVQFFNHHGFLELKDRPHWRVVDGGSHAYVKKLIAPFNERIRLNAPVVSIARFADQVRIAAGDGTRDIYDAVFVAAHSDEALSMLEDPTPAERGILGAMPYAENPVVLHTDTSLLPKRKRAWASWNYLLPDDARRGSTVTYNQNILQGLDAPETFCVTLNQTDLIDPAHVIQSFTYHHPQFTVDSVRAQKRKQEISGHNKTYYCGAYWGFGFHEDGVNSAIDAVNHFKEDLACAAAYTKVG